MIILALDWMYRWQRSAFCLTKAPMIHVRRGSFTFHIGIANAEDAQIHLILAFIRVGGDALIQIQFHGIAHDPFPRMNQPIGRFGVD